MDKKNVTRKELTFAVAEKLGIPQRDSAGIVDIFFSVLREKLSNGESIKMR